MATPGSPNTDHFLVSQKFHCTATGTKNRLPPKKKSPPTVMPTLSLTFERNPSPRMLNVPRTELHERGAARGGCRGRPLADGAMLGDVSAVVDAGTDGLDGAHVLEERPEEVAGSARVDLAPPAGCVVIAVPLRHRVVVEIE